MYTWGIGSGINDGLTNLGERVGSGIAIGMATLGDSASVNIAAAITNAGRDIGAGIGKIGEGIGMPEGTSVLGWPLQLWPTVSIFCSTYKHDTSFCGRYSKRLARPYMPSLIVTGSVLSDGSWYAYPYPALATNA